ncbi:STAS-like domain-containing protein [Hymenobacter psoromatis]|uniref:STAS-like domain-containing protein n=1 Tax=Hymenobacter psoromatis TaxID=1484116 RepID=UPI001CBF3D2A|nr:STAS-like domain-containing protein [Hymenobacter psoromatis]
MNTIPHNGAVLCVSTITNGTISNIDGLALLVAVKNALAEFNNAVSIDFQGVIAFSSSFLNSSIGALCEEMGIDVLHRLRIINCSPAALKQLRTYIADTKEIA